MIITKKVEININSRNIKYYNNYFNDIKVGQKLNIDIDILNKNSHTKVNVLCDNCCCEKNVQFSSLKKDLYYCSKCAIKIYLSKKLDNEKIIDLYNVEKMTVLDISKKMNVRQELISKILKLNNIQITKKDRNCKKYILTDEHRRKVSENGKKNKGIKCSLITNYKNMANHLKYDVDYLWLYQFEDFSKLKFLNSVISRDYYKLNTETYKKYIVRFYNDENFDRIYNKWLNNDKNKWLIPSLDHINPKVNDDLDDIDNFQFLTWFENRSKNNINPDEWKIMKENIYFYFT